MNDLDELPSDALLPVKAEVPLPAIPEKQDAPITAAQAKVDAVANLTFKAYERAGTLTLTAEESEALQKEFPDDAFQSGAGGNAQLIYIEHAHLRNRLNSVLGLGQWALIVRNRWEEPFRTTKGRDGHRVYVEAMLVIRGCFVGEAIGNMDYYPNDSTNYGDAVEGAKTAAFRRCAKELGVGLQAWSKQWCEGWWARKRGGRMFAKPTPLTAAQAREPAQKVAVDIATEENYQQFMDLCKSKLVKVLSVNSETKTAATEFFKAQGMLLPTESIEDVSPFTLWPGTSPSFPRDQNQKIIADLKAQYMRGIQEVADRLQSGQPPVQVPDGVKVNGTQDDSWKSYPIPQWSKHARKYKTFGELPKNLLWWWCEKWEPKPWVGENGKEYLPSKWDIALREILDKVASHYDFKPSGEDNGAEPDERAGYPGDPAEYGDA